MKKLFGLFALLLCTILLSCNNLFSDKTGDISFSFSADDAIQAANAYLARGADNDGQSEYIFLVQIQGSEGFHDYQIKTVQATNVDSSYAASGQYLTDNKLEFLFDYVPFDQTYKVMFDMFAKIDSNLPHLVLSGNSNDIEVMPSIQTEVVVNIGNFTTSPISLKVEYTNGNIDTINGLGSISNGNPNNQSPLSLRKEYGKLWGGSDNKLVKRVYYELDPNSNFPESSFKYSLPCTYQSTIKAHHNFSFQDGTSSPKDFLFSYSFPDDYPRYTDQPSALNSSAKANISKGNFTFEEYLPKFEYRSYDEVISGHSGNVQLQFNKKNYDGGSAFVYAAELSSFINGGTSIQNGDSIALVLTMKNNKTLASGNNLLYYKMINNSSFLNSETIDGQELFDGNNCLTCKPGEKRFVIPVNSYSTSKSKLLLFINGDSGSSTENYSFDIDYYIFPNKMDAFVFGIESVKNEFEIYYDRYEMDETTVDHTNFSGNFTEGSSYSSTLTGVVCYFNLLNRNFSLARTELTAELYDSTNGFQVFSNNFALGGNIKNLQTSGTYDFSTGNDSYTFTFNSVIQPDNGAQNKCKFLCTAPFQDSNTLLVVRNFNLLIEKVN